MITYEIVYQWVYIYLYNMVRVDQVNEIPDETINTVMYSSNWKCMHVPG